MVEARCRRRCESPATARGRASAGGLDGGRAGLERIAGTPVVLGGRSGGAAKVPSMAACGRAADRRWRRRTVAAELETCTEALNLNLTS